MTSGDTCNSVDRSADQTVWKSDTYLLLFIGDGVRHEISRFSSTIGIDDSYIKATSHDVGFFFAYFEREK
jgi:hypothetical protein